MSDFDRPHILVQAPVSKNTRTFSGGGGGTYKRDSYEDHSRFVLAEAKSLVKRFEEQRDTASTKRRFYRVRLPKGYNVWSSKGAGVADALHSEIVGAPEAGIGHLTSSAASLELTLEELERYAGPNSVGRSKFAPIEEIGPIPGVEKVSKSASTRLSASDQEELEVLLSLFQGLGHIEVSGVMVKSCGSSMIRRRPSWA